MAEAIKVSETKGGAALGRPRMTQNGAHYSVKWLINLFCSGKEAIKRRDKDGETLRSIARSYNVSAATISRLQT
jgi:hypothetical protein